MGILDVVVVLVLVVVVVIFLRASVCAVSILEKFSSQLVTDGNTNPSCLVSAITGVGHREESSTQLLSWPAQRKPWSTTRTVQALVTRHVVVVKVDSYPMPRTEYSVHLSCFHFVTGR